MGDDMYKFTTLTEKEFDKFTKDHEQSHFLQSIYMNNYYKLNDKKTYILGVKEADKVVASALVLEHSSFKKYKKFCIYKGPTLDYDDIKLLDFFLNNIIKFLKEKNCYELTIDPNVIEVERDTDAKVIENAKDNYKAIKSIKNLGFKKCKYDPQIKWCYALDIKDRTPEELLASFRSTNRNYINKTIKKFNLQIENLSKEELYKFKTITEETSLRRGFKDKTMKYYEDIYDSFKDNVKFMLCYLDCDKCINNYETENKEKENQINTLSNSNSNLKKKEVLKVDIENNLKRIEELNKLKKEKGNRIDLSAAMFMLFGKEIIYLFSGSYEEYMQYFGQYRIQWEIIKYASEHKYRDYNFYGIYGAFNKNEKDYGVFEFKRSFNGYVKELIGEYYICLNKKVKLLYNFNRLFSKIAKR